MGANNTRLFVLLLTVAAALGIGNMWIYPYHSFNYTGLFFIPYIIALIVLGMPLLMLELSMGQYFNKNIVDLFASVRKWFSSIGWLMLFNAFIAMSFSAVILSWHIIYLFVSFGLQWKNGASKYFFSNVIQASDGFHGFASFSLPVFIALIMAWLIIFFYIRKGFATIKKAFLATFPVFAFLMLLFFVYSLSLDNALHGVYSFLKPNLKGLLKGEVWLASFALALTSLGLSFGIFHALGSKSEKGFLAGYSLIAIASKLLVSIAIGFIMFSILGFLSMKQSVELSQIVFADFSSFFTILAQALPFFYKPTLLSFLFFAFFSVFFIFGAASLGYAISHVLVHKFNTKQVNAAILVSGFGFLLGLIFVIKPGIYIMELVTHFFYYNVLIAILLEVVAIGWFFNIDKLSQHINQHSILKIGGLCKLIARYIAPLTIILLLFLQIRADLLVNYGFFVNYSKYQLWALLAFGIGTVAAPLVAAFLMPQRLLDRG
ncbi:hypothetical protein HYT53_03800 [Candidatus Woesearchaeota archaeon]|nr:hypothetical protein [Candidatus Woesearchaeota archaeon]